jgi:hypothetical protein
MITQKRIKSGTLLLGVFTLLVLVISISLVSGITAKIGNARMVLYPEFENGKAVIEKSVRVINDNNVSVNVSLYYSEDFEGIIEIIDENFVLQPGEEKDARFVLTITDEKEDYDGRINILFKELEAKNGVALSSRIIIHAGDGKTEDDSIKNPFSDSLFGGIGIFLAITTFLLIVSLAVLFYFSNKRDIERKRKEKGKKRDGKKGGEIKKLKDEKKKE